MLRSPQCTLGVAIRGQGGGLRYPVSEPVSSQSIKDLLETLAPQRPSTSGLEHVACHVLKSPRGSGGRVKISPCIRAAGILPETLKVMEQGPGLVVGCLVRLGPWMAIAEACRHCPGFHWRGSQVPLTSPPAPPRSLSLGIQFLQTQSHED